MGTLWSTNPEEDEESIRIKGLSLNDDPIVVSEKEDNPSLNEIEKKDMAAKRLAYISTKYAKPKFVHQPKKSASEDRRYDQYLKDLRS